MKAKAQSRTEPNKGSISSNDPSHDEATTRALNAKIFVAKAKSQTSSDEFRRLCYEAPSRRLSRLLRKAAIEAARTGSEEETMHLLSLSARLAAETSRQMREIIA